MGDWGERGVDKKVYERKKDFRKKVLEKEREEGGTEQGCKKKKKKEQASSRVGPGGLRGLLCGDWRVTGVPIEWPAMTVPPENASYASGVALMEPEKGCSCLPWRSDIVQLDKAA